jgi:hypothetical protein
MVMYLQDVIKERVDEKIVLLKEQLQDNLITYFSEQLSQQELNILCDIVINTIDEVDISREIKKA